MRCEYKNQINLKQCNRDAIASVSGHGHCAKDHHRKFVERHAAMIARESGTQESHGANFNATQ